MDKVVDFGAALEKRRQENQQKHEKLMEQLKACIAYFQGEHRKLLSDEITLHEKKEPEMQQLVVQLGGEISKLFQDVVSLKVLPKEEIIKELEKLYEYTYDSARSEGDQATLLDFQKKMQEILGDDQPKTTQAFNKDKQKI